MTARARPPRPRSGAVPAVGLWCGLGAALTFGLGAPLSARLVRYADPLLLAGLLYAGAFAVLAPLRLAVPRTVEARLRRRDAPLLVVVTLTGGVVAPVLLLVGLRRVGGLSGSLLLNLEAPATMLLAVTVFREHLPRRAVAGAVAIVAGAVALDLGGDGSLGASGPGTGLVAAACLLWGLDNNLSQRLASRDPLTLVGVKTGVAAIVNLGGAAAIGAARPPPGTVAAALAVGAVAYGASVLLDAYALRHLGAAREAALFATAPFAGAVAAAVLFDETWHGAALVAGGLMALGVVVLVRAGHDHLHDHLALRHDHAHRHDDGHHDDHDHGDGSAALRHAHEHAHAWRRHAHPHPSDDAHRHRH